MQGLIVGPRHFALSVLWLIRSCQKVIIISEIFGCSPARLADWSPALLFRHDSTTRTATARWRTSSTWVTTSRRRWCCCCCCCCCSSWEAKCSFCFATISMSSLLSMMKTLRNEKFQNLTRFSHFLIFFKVLLRCHFTRSSSIEMLFYVFSLSKITKK